jgi:Zn-dependent peptidase ImmA (M78 family)
MKYSDEWNNLVSADRNTIGSFHSSIPVRVGEIAKAFGLIVRVSTLDVGISGMIFPDGESYKIVINKHEPVYRQRFTLAHELAHYLLHRELIGAGISDNVLYRSKLSDKVEAEANRLASDILMPVERVKEAKLGFSASKLADALSPLAGQFGVSEDAMRIRLGMK